MKDIVNFMLNNTINNDDDIQDLYDKDPYFHRIVSMIRDINNSNSPSELEYSISLLIEAVVTLSQEKRGIK